ncbi:MAG: helix-hairpin-helix domain-containing protein, partial [Acidobacteriota bacterium]
MSLNSELAARFSDMAMALELLGANRFRVNAYQRVARLVKDATRDFGAIVEDDPETALQRLQALDGVGKATAEKIVEFVADGAIAEHVELL